MFRPLQTPTRHDLKSVLHLPLRRCSLLLCLALGELRQKLVDPLLVRLDRGQYLPNRTLYENPAHQAVGSSRGF